MDTLQKVARRHGFVCLLHEKPFAGVNGSGKHNNWSMATDAGANLLDPGETPHDNMVFLVMLCAVVRAVDKYATLLRASVANAGNDHRLGANEAPPAIVSVFLGEQLTDIFEQLAKGVAKSSRRGGTLKLGVSTLPQLPKDSTDRNRTSPFAFTGNKFEFRMVGSSQSVSGPSFTLNTIVADILSDIADELEKASDVAATAQKILQDIVTKHSRVVFNGDNYCEEWTAEAARRGLPNIRSTVESLKTIPSKENFALFSKHGVLSEAELRARTEILFEAYSRQVNVEAQTMLNMARRQILPACCEYSARLGQAVAAVSAAGVGADTHKAMLKRVCDLITSLQASIEALDKARTKAAGTKGHERQAENYRNDVVPAMQALRAVADDLETIVDARLWPLPTYAEMLFVR
jgi:glutamine synthetase